MKIERTKNATRNILFGTILKIYEILTPFLLRTAMIYFMGVQYLGLNSLFSSILQVLNLAELGVGSAMVFSMYKPIAEDDTQTICALMRLYKIYYRIIGGVIATVGIILTPFIPQLIKGELPSGLNIYILYWLNLGATVLSYWLFAYKNSILNAHQRVDITSKIHLITNTIQYILQFSILWIARNYYMYIIAAMVVQILNNVITAIIANNLYPDYQPQGKLSVVTIKNINQRVRDLFTSKLGFIVVNSADTIVISSFLGLTVLAIYQNYYFILTSVMGFISVVYGACTAGIGNSLIIETEEKNFNDLHKFTFIICWIATFCSCCFLNLYQPFMVLWIGKQYLLDFTAVIIFVVYFYICEVNQLLNLYKDAAGIWHEDRFRPLVTAIVNLSMNLIMVQFFGIYGVLLSTVLSMLFVGMPWLFHNLFTTIFKPEKLLNYIKKLFIYVIISITISVITTFLCQFITGNNFCTLLLRFINCCVLPNVLLLIIYYRSQEFKQSVDLADKMTKGRFDLVHLFHL